MMCADIDVVPGENGNIDEVAAQEQKVSQRMMV